MTPEEYFSSDKSVCKKRYDALRTFFVDMLPAAEAAAGYGYTLASFYSLIRDFRKHLNGNHRADFFFKDVVLGRKPGKEDELRELIINLRKKYYSAQEIVAIADSMGHKTSYGFVYNVLREEKFAPMPRRSSLVKKQLESPVEAAPAAEKLTWETEKFFSSHTGLFAFLPIIFRYDIHRPVEHSSYPFTREISRLSSILWQQRKFYITFPHFTAVPLGTKYW